jgi:sigma-B regulation protein RsbU (phosphoserine phosphatase)
MDTDWRGSELDAAARLQRALLPPSPFARGGWTAAHRYVPAGRVGGDILDLIPARDDLYFVIVDVSGKGVAASMLTTYVHAVFRTLIPFRLPVEEIVRRASALLCASTLPAQYATLVFGVLRADGEVIVANAGHPPPRACSARPHSAARD